MARKTKALTGSVKEPIALVLQSVEIKKCNMERHLPRFKAPKGKLDSKLNLGIHIAEGNDIEGVMGRLSITLTGIGSDADDKRVDSFSVEFELEGFYRPKNPEYKLREDDLTRPLADRIAQELYPLAMMRSYDLLSMIGYGGVRLSYGLETE
jgi:hypothetical protein